MQIWVCIHRAIVHCCFSLLSSAFADCWQSCCLLEVIVSMIWRETVMALSVDVQWCNCVYHIVLQHKQSMMWWSYWGRERQQRAAGDRTAAAAFFFHCWKARVASSYYSLGFITISQADGAKDSSQREAELELWAPETVFETTEMASDGQMCPLAPSNPPRKMLRIPEVDLVFIMCIFTTNSVIKVVQFVGGSPRARL